MVPAHQGFEPDDAAGFDVDLRLVLQRKAVAFNRGYKFASENYALAGKLAERLVMKTDAIAAGIFRTVKREIGLHQQDVRSIQFLGIARNTDAGRDARGVPFA